MLCSPMLYARYFILTNSTFSDLVSIRFVVWLYVLSAPQCLLYKYNKCGRVCVCICDTCVSLQANEHNANDGLIRCSKCEPCSCVGANHCIHIHIHTHKLLFSLILFCYRHSYLSRATWNFAVSGRQANHTAVVIKQAMA